MCIEVQLTQDDLASMAGTTRVTANKIPRELEVRPEFRPPRVTPSPRPGLTGPRHAAAKRRHKTQPQSRETKTSTEAGPVYRSISALCERVMVPAASALATFAQAVRSRSYGLSDTTNLA